MVILFPLISFAGNFATFILGKEKTGKGLKNPFATKEELRIILTSEKSLQGRYETVFVRRILNFASATVREHMTPISRTVSMSKNAKVVDMVRIIAESGFSRIPIFDGEERNIIGIIDARDLLEKSNMDETVESKIRKVLTVHENEKIQNLLRDFQKEGCHLALVENDQKRVSGIITVEDILEEIVGEILDEFDRL